MKHDVMPIHPDDILLFSEVTSAMRRVAKEYELPLATITGYPMPLKSMADRLGDCSHTGHIRLVLRCTVDGQWCEAPLDPEQVWDTAAHELAHLRHFNHGDAFASFYEELLHAIRNQRQSHKKKIIAKLTKMAAQAKSEESLGNSEAAEAFAAAVNKMMLQYELEPSDLEYAAATKDDPIIEMKANFGSYGIKPSKTRIAWQEWLAGRIAKAHMCEIFIRTGSNSIWFVGTQSHTTVAEYIFGTMVPFIEKESKRAEYAYWVSTGCGRGDNNQAKGYRASWIDSFTTRIWERFKEAREAAVQEAESSELALVRLDGALLRSKAYINDKFKAAKTASVIGSTRGFKHEQGRKDGVAAANKVTLGARAINAAAARKQIG
jgi:predicted metal-dependent hydrolase